MGGESTFNSDGDGVALMWMVFRRPMPATDGRFVAVRLKYDSSLLVFLYCGLLKFGLVLENLI